MVLSPTEEDGVRKLLRSLDDSKLPSILNTITSGIIKSQDHSKCVDLIVKYCKDAFDVLKRQKVTKSDLFKYLKGENVDISPKADKGDMIQSCLKLWQASLASEQQLAEFKDWEMADVDDDGGDGGDDLLTSEAKPLTEDRLVNMGRTFVTWFYERLKTCNDIHLFNASLFWPDCTLEIEINDPKDQHKIEKTTVSGDNNVYEYIRFVFNKLRVGFAPNVYNDPKATLTLSGLVVIEIEGVVHQYTFPRGVFRHTFGLIQDPSCVGSETWKIKFVQMSHKVGERFQPSI